MLFIPVPLLLRGLFSLCGLTYRGRRFFLFCALLYVLLNAPVTAALLTTRRRCAKT